jgi:hypothetical protein
VEYRARAFEHAASIISTIASALAVLEGGATMAPDCEAKNRFSSPPALDVF